MENIEQKYINSREVAEMVGKEHKILMRDIRKYNEYFNQSKIVPVDFWQESTYTDSKGEIRPCYNVTKKGCEFIAHKLTGTKGTEFTAKYINRFHEMEDALSSGATEKVLKILETMQGKIDRLESQLNRQKSIEEKKNDGWYQENKFRIFHICEKNNIKPKKLYKMLIESAKTLHNYDDYLDRYHEENGRYPEYGIELFSVYGELWQFGNDILDFVLGEKDSYS